MAAGRSLPQPAGGAPLTYELCDGISELHHGVPYRAAADGGCCALAAGALVWVSLAKKKGGDGSAGELFSRATVVSDPLAAPEGSAVRATAGDGGGKRRVHVRYPQGSSYRVRRRMLAPILPVASDPSEGGGMVVVTPDTACYRRLCRIHALPGDAFLEIGCDLGACTVGVAESMAAALPSADSVVVTTAFGVDKSVESVAEARRRHCPLSAAGGAEGAAGPQVPGGAVGAGGASGAPRVVFEEADALTDDGVQALRQRCVDVLGAFTFSVSSWEGPALTQEEACVLPQAARQPCSR